MINNQKHHFTSNLVQNISRKIEIWAKKAKKQLFCWFSVIFLWAPANSLLIIFDHTNFFNLEILLLLLFLEGIWNGRL